MAKLVIGKEQTERREIDIPITSLHLSQHKDSADWLMGRLTLVDEARISLESHIQFLKDKKRLYPSTNPDHN